MLEHEILLGKTSKGKYISFGGSEHVALHARSGSGKTSSFTIPNCFFWGGSLIALDIKRECFEATAGYRAAMGQDVYLLDPAADDGCSHRWDPFASVKRDSVDRFDQISRIGFILFPEHQTGSSGSSNSDAFWIPAARQAFTAAATLIAETPSYPLTMAAVLRIFSRGDSHEWLTERIEGRRHSGSPYSELVVDGVHDYLDGALQQVSGIRKSVSTRLSAWYNPRIAAATAASDFDLRDLRRKAMTIYVSVAPGNMARMRPLLQLFFEQAVLLNADKTPSQDLTITNQALILLDEFARLGRIDSLVQAAQWIRGYGVRLAFAIQNKAQLKALYGPFNALDVFDNLGAEICYATTDIDLMQELEKRLGDNTATVTTKNRPRFWPSFRLSKQGESEHPHRRPLMLAQEVARMATNEQIIIRPGMLPMKTGRVEWFSDSAFYCRAMPAIPVPQLRIDVPDDDGSTSIRSRYAMHDITREEAEANI